MATVMLLDGNSLTYRAFFALPTDMATASGQVTNAVYGFTAMLIYLLKEHQPDGVIVAFDRPEPTFRHVQIPTYKAQREEAPDILRQQMGLVREVIAALGVQTLEMAGWEADDIIATLVDKVKARGDHAIIVTGDRDSYQLVEDPWVRVLYNKRGVSDYALYDEAGIMEKTGVTPAQYPEYAALRGDPSDNLPGVPGVGEKTAAKLITTYGGLDGIFANADAQTPKLRESLKEHEARARENVSVMVLRRDAPIEVDLDDASVKPDQAEVKRLFEFLEFRSLIDRLREALAGMGAEAPKIATGAVLDATVVHAAGADAAVAALAPGPVSLGAAWLGAPGRSELVGIAVRRHDDADGTDPAGTDAAGTDPAGTDAAGTDPAGTDAAGTDPAGTDVVWVPAALLDDGRVRAALSAAGPVHAHNAKELMRTLLAAEVDVATLVLDTAIAAYLIDPAETQYAIGELLTKYTGDSLPADGAPAGQLDFGDNASDDVVRAARAALAVSRLAPVLQSALEAQGMRELYDTIENPLVRVLARMEHVGVGVEGAELKALNDTFTAECARLQAQVHAVAGREFNLNSPIQLREILFDERGLTPVKKTKTGPSTDAQSLEKLRDQWPEFIDPLLDYREVEKLRGTYGEGLLAEVADDGRIHATFNQTVARTGRLSSDQPNLHNIPVRSDVGRQFRKAFVPAHGRRLLIADYNQIELRCIAHLAEDPGLIEAFTSGLDIHNATASRVFSVETSAVTVDQRSKAKMVSYGLAYGMESYGLAQRLNIAVEDASVILDAYFAAFPNVKAYMERTVKEARMRGYTETLFGRRRPIPDLQNPNYRMRQAAERQAMNAGIQGLAADIFKVALVRLDAALATSGFDAPIVLQVHDEVLVEVPEGDEDAVGELTVGVMRGAAELRVPLEVNLTFGDTWAAAKG